MDASTQQKLEDLGASLTEMEAELKRQSNASTTADRELGKAQKAFNGLLSASERKPAQLKLKACSTSSADRRAGVRKLTQKISSAQNKIAALKRDPKEVMKEGIAAKAAARTKKLEAKEAQRVKDDNRKKELAKPGCKDHDFTGEGGLLGRTGVHGGVRCTVAPSDQALKRKAAYDHWREQVGLPPCRAPLPLL